MLADRNEVIKLLRCPKTGRELTLGQDSLYCEDELGRCDYKIVNGYPVLIDFDNSVFRANETSLAPPVKRKSYSGLVQVLKSLVSTPHAVTKANVKSLQQMLAAMPGRCRILIIGGGTIGQGMAELYATERFEIVSFDVYASPHVQFIADAHEIPLPSDTFDAVIVQAVLEHVLEPATVVREIHRVLKPSGLVYSETPFMQHVHEGAYDFTRFTELGHRYLFRNFRPLRAGVLSGAGTQLQWSLDYFFRGLFRSRKMGKLVKLCFFWLQYFDRIIPLPYNVDAAGGVFFLGVKDNNKVELGKAEIASYYQGAQ